MESDDPSAAKLLKLLAYFDNQNIWYGLLSAGLTEKSPIWLQELMVDEVDFESVMRTLVYYCLMFVGKPFCKPNFGGSIATPAHFFSLYETLSLWYPRLFVGKANSNT